MKNSLVNVPVLLLFFVRPETLQYVFEKVKEARPSKLFLFQDGARDGKEGDIKKIEECRKIVEEIDWECEVHRNYSDTNLTCDHAEFSAITWAFQYVDRLVILEDDVLPNSCFFSYCAELLERYKNDERVHMIAGLNHLEDCSDIVDESYFFSKVISIWGWATWKSEWEKCDLSFNYLKDEKIRRLILENIEPKSWAKAQIKRASVAERQYLERGTIYSFEVLNAMAMHLNSSYSIVPVQNMISNIGLSSESVHSVDNIKKLPKGIRWIFNMKQYEMQFPLKHPQYMLENKEYRKKTFSKMARDNKIKLLYRKIDSKLRRMIIK